MKRLKIFTWHVHGSYLYYLSQIPHDIYLPKRPGGESGYHGITPSYPWPANLYEIPADSVRTQDFDCIVYQSHQNYLTDQYEILSEEQRRLPRVYLEHDPPRESPTDTYHPVDDPNVLVVHCTDFNRLMWDCRRSPTTVIDHGVLVPEHVRYRGDLPRGIVVVNNIRKRGRRLGYDIYQEAKDELDLDLFGMGWEEAQGKGELPFSELHTTASRYRYFFNPIRYTSLGLSICEAMMIGMPVIGLATAELATVIENDVSGFISTRPDELKAAARALIEDPGLARKWGEGARRKAQERFSINRFVADWNRNLSLVTGKKLTEEKTWTSPS